MIEEQEFKAAVRQWVAQSSDKGASTVFDDDTPLIEQRVITSLQVMDLLLFIEEITGRSIDVERLQPGDFHSVNAIYRHFGEVSRKAA
jgi:acyl carrier protein